MEKIKKEELFNYYITENHTVKETSEFFKCSETTIKKFLKSFAIHKDKELVSEKKKNIDKIAILARLEKTKRTLLERYGTDNPMKIKEFKEKAQSTNLEKYGDKNPNKNKEVLKKRAKTNLEKYGSSCCLGNNKIREKAKKRCLEKYGDEYPLRSAIYKDELLKKRHETNLERYGCEEITSTEYFKNKVKEKCLERYGTNFPNESIYSNSIFSSLENFEEYLKNKNLNKPAINDLIRDLSVSDSYLLKKIHNLKADDLVNLKPTRSSDEKAIYNFLVEELGIPETEIIVKDTSILDGLELDLYLPKYKTAIEYNGNYWHSSIYKDANYHQNKSIAAEKKGVHLMHIYEYEWNDSTKQKIVCSIIRNALGKNTNKVFARKCELKEVSKKDAHIFLDENHLQGYRGGSKIYGLYFAGSLVQIMIFGKNSKYDWEIIRAASAINTNVVGGTSKLLAHFIKENNPKSIFSYCDFNTFSGSGYEKNGMEYLGLTVPDMKWLINGKVFNRNPGKHREMKKLAEAKICGAGSKKYLINLKKVKENEEN